MSRMVVVGGSVVGSATALLLARAGNRVIVVDPELPGFAAPGPLSVRRGSPHNVQAHAYMGRVHHELASRLPDVLATMLDQGARAVGLAEVAPPALHDGGRPGDDELRLLRARRVLLDRVLAQAVLAEPGVEVVTTRASALRLDGTRVTGVGLADGTLLPADVVVDAAGKRSPVPRWLRDAGCAPVERVDPGGVRYYTRHYRLRDPESAPRPNRGFLEGHEFPTLVQLLFLGDEDTAMLAYCVHGRDEALKRVRDAEVFTAVAAANPGLAAWLDAMEPISEVFALGASDNHYRRLVADGRPVAVGVHQVGDALAATNPVRGRGVALGLAAAGALSDTLAAHDGADATLAYDTWCERTLAVYYREAVAANAYIEDVMRSVLQGTPGPPNAPSIELPAGHPVTSAELDRAGWADPDLFRVTMRAAMAMDDDRAVASDRVAADVRRVLATLPAPEPAPAPSGGLHDRVVLEGVLAAHA